MKYWNLPDTFVNHEMPKLPGACQAVLFALLWHSNKAYKPVWCTLPTISRRAGIKSLTTTRKHVETLVKRNIIAIQYCQSDQRQSKYGKLYTVDQIVYTFTMQRWIDWDIELNLSEAKDFIAEETERSIAQQAAHEILQNLPQKLKQFLDVMEYTSEYNGVLNFKSKERLSRPFIEKEFRKHGLKINIA